MADISPISALFRDLYYSIYVLFFRFSRWDHDTKESLAAAAISVVKVAFVVGLACWIQVFANQRLEFDRWIAVPLYLVIYAVDFWFLVVRDGARRFEEQFNYLPRRRQVFLRLSALMLVLTSFVFLLVSVSVYHKVFGIQ